MSKMKRRNAPPHSLVEDNPSDTLDCCDAVLCFMQDREEETPGDESAWGQELVLQCVRDALRFTSHQLQMAGREPRAKKPKLVVSNPPPAA